MYQDRALHIHMIKALLVNIYVIDLWAEQLTSIFEVLVHSSLKVLCQTQTNILKSR